MSEVKNEMKCKNVGCNCTDHAGDDVCDCCAKTNTKVITCSGEGCTCKNCKGPGCGCCEKTKPAKSDTCKSCPDDCNCKCNSCSVGTCCKIKTDVNKGIPFYQ